MSVGAEPYERLASLAELERELVTAGDYDALGRLHAERQALIASLPERPPAVAAAALRRAELIQANVGIELIRRREAVLEAQARVAHARRAARGYRAAGWRGARLDASA